MTSVPRVLDLARAELGYVEGPRDNQNRYAPRAGHADRQPWCASFVVAIMRAAGIRLPSESAYTPAMANGFRAAKRWTTRPQVGAVVFYAWPGMGRIAHVGIVEAVRADGRIVAIEGNTDSAGGRTGGRVMRQVRQAHIAGYGLPAYTASDSGTAPTVAVPITPTEQVQEDTMLRLLKRADDGVQYLIGSGVWRRLGPVDDATAKATVDTARVKGLLVSKTELVDAREYELLRAVYVGSADA